MRKILLFILLVSPVYCFAQQLSKTDAQRLWKESKSVTIIRDKWGIPHIYGKTDADAVFGLMYVQCEENFKGIERNYLYQLGKQTEADGPGNLYTDVQLQLIADTADAIKEYEASPRWFKDLMDAFADGVNYYLFVHPEVKPLVFKHFEPWYALMFTDGSVAATETGGINLDETAQFYSSAPATGAVYKPRTIDNVITERETGSNGFALAPSKTASKYAMLYINPHVPFYFRDEVHIVSEQGLNVYGAVTWGQFFVYQGFNQHCGWMHTSSYADVADLYAEQVTKKEGKWYYLYNDTLKPVMTRNLLLKIKKTDSTYDEKTITGYYTHHGPVLGSRDGKWMALKANNRSYKALLESWLITRSDNMEEYKRAMGLLSNASNNTVYADDKGNIALWYGNYIPKRDPKLDWGLPVDGSTPATEWQGVHLLDEIVHVYNPATGWIENCNSTPYTSSGTSSPDKKKYPGYMAPDGQNYRAVNAIKLLSDAKNVSLDDLIAKGNNHYLTLFDALVPSMLNAYDAADDSVKEALEEPVKLLRQWDRRSDLHSIATTLAVEWGTQMLSALPRVQTVEESTYQTQRMAAMLKAMGPQKQLDMLDEAVKSLQKRYGAWKIEWGSINRYQRPPDGITFDDKHLSIPVGLVGSPFGQLPSFQSRTFDTQKRYGYSGNSFVVAVEFGPHIRAKSIITGGESFDPGSEHFTDQAQGFINGQFKDVLFYKADVLKNAESSYHPGERNSPGK